MEKTTALDAKKVDKYVWLTRQIKENWILSQWAKLKRQTDDTADEEPPDYQESATPDTSEVVDKCGMRNRRTIWNSV